MDVLVVYGNDDAAMQLVGCRTNVHGQYGSESAKPDDGYQRVVLSKVFGQQ